MRGRNATSSKLIEPFRYVTTETTLLVVAETRCFERTGAKEILSTLRVAESFDGHARAWSSRRPTRSLTRARRRNRALFSRARAPKRQRGRLGMPRDDPRLWRRGRTYRMSDAAHPTQAPFHAVHATLSKSTAATFIELHGNTQTVPMRGSAMPPARWERQSDAWSMPWRLLSARANAFSLCGLVR